MDAETAVWFATVPVLAWMAAVGMLALGQRSFIYHPPARHSRCPDWMTEVRQNQTLLGWWSPPARQDAPVLAVFHGNRGTLERIAIKMEPWRALGYGLFAATYPGYEGNRGRPSEQSLYQAGRTALSWIESQGISTTRIILYGESLGSGVATELAVGRTPAGLILEAPFACLAGLAAKRFPFVPAALLLRDKFDNVGKIGHIACPILIVHGEADRTVPFANAEHLQAAAPNAVLVRLLKAGHINLYEHGAIRAISDFLGRLY